MKNTVEEIPEWEQVTWEDLLRIPQKEKAASGPLERTGVKDKLHPVPLSREQVGEYVDRMHRHHSHRIVDRYRIGCEFNGEIVGVVQVGNPVSTALCDGYTLEVSRLCTNGDKNVCSFLYGAAARVAKELGYRKIITYILETETGTSLRAAGWHKEADTHGHGWSRPNRPRKATGPICDKQRWAKILK